MVWILIRVTPDPDLTKMLGSETKTQAVLCHCSKHINVYESGI